MSKKVIKLRHKVCDYTCMWNGIEDLYQTRLGEDIPDFFLLFKWNRRIYILKV
ncbi:hypothetical protein JQ038_05995 [Clostridium botulinum]|nr:hypothetical protein [Clostridium botulinum]MCS4482268.1 hypothetical protein [Clostridium botulinum]